MHLGLPRKQMMIENLTKLCMNKFLQSDVRSSTGAWHSAIKCSYLGHRACVAIVWHTQLTQQYFAPGCSMESKTAADAAEAHLNTLASIPNDLSSGPGTLVIKKDISFQVRSPASPAAKCLFRFRIWMLMDSCTHTGQCALRTQGECFTKPTTQRAKCWPNACIRLVCTVSHACGLT